MQRTRFFARAKNIFGTSFLSMRPNNILRFSSTSSLHSSQKTNFERSRLFQLSPFNCNSLPSLGSALSTGILQELAEKTQELEMQKNSEIERILSFSGSFQGCVSQVEVLPNSLEIGRLSGKLSVNHK